MSTPTPEERLREWLSRLPAAIRALDAALERAQARARNRRGPVWLSVAIEVGPDGVEAMDVSERYERRVESGVGGAT